MKVKVLLSGLILSCMAMGDYAWAFPTDQSVPPVGPFSDAPDVVLNRFCDEGMNEETVGDRITNDDAQQTISSVVLPGLSQDYLVEIKNRSQNPTTFRVSMGGLLANGGTETVWASKGWTARATLEGQTTDIFTHLTDKDGWETPVIDAGSEVVIRLSLYAPTSTALPVTMGSFRVVARKGNLSDAVIGQISPQFITKIQWMLNGDKKWHDITEKTSVLLRHHEPLGVRAEKANPAMPWGGNIVLGPAWTFQGTTVEGEDGFLEPHATAVTGTTVTGTLGTSYSFQVRVLPEARVQFQGKPIHPVATLAAQATQTQPIVIALKVKDIDGSPVTQTKIRLRSFSENTAIASFWTPVGKDKAEQSTEEVVLTDEQGEAKIQWAVKAGVVPLESKAEVKAEVLDENGQTFGYGDSVAINVEAEGTP